MMAAARSDIEPALIGWADIAAVIETWWRSKRRRVPVSRYHVETWIRRYGLPATRVGRGRWNAAPSEVFAWCERVLLPSAGSQSSPSSQSSILTRTD